MGRLADPSVIGRLHAAVDAVRDLVNVKRRHRALMRAKAAYNTVCSAMDTIGDTAQALGAYDEFEKTTDKGQAYLLTYGTLQTLYLQQDAGFWLGKSLKLESFLLFNRPGKWAESVDVLWAARTARNNSIGHPVRRGVVKPLASFFIVQHSLDAEGFQLIEMDDAGSHRFVNVDVGSLAQAQGDALVGILQSAEEQLIQADRDH